MDESRLPDTESSPEFVGSSRAAVDLRKLIARVARSLLPVLVQGESGVGRTFVARLIHEGSQRCGPLTIVNLADLSSNLGQAELFGYARGAFTGASSPKEGLIESADTGTLLLEGLEAAPTEVQALLLHFLELGTIRRLGETVERRIDVRTIATAGPNARMAGHIREDLYYRLATFALSVPPLRQRMEDIEDLARHFIRTADATKTLHPDAVHAIAHYSFPGNVRELRMIVQRSLAVASGDLITVEDLMLPEESIMTGAHLADDLKRELNSARNELESLRGSTITASPIWEGRSFPVEAGSCFVLMPYEETADLQKVYRNHVKPVLESKCGLRCERADDINDVNGVMQSVWESINRARLVIADLTRRNPNVFYELGIAHTLGKPVIMIAQSMEYVPFDLRHLRCIVYEYKPERIEEFERRLEVTVRRVLSSRPAPSARVEQQQPGESGQ